MKILFCLGCPAENTFGAARVTLHLQEEFKKLGWETKILTPKDIIPPTENLDGWNNQKNYTHALYQYLLSHGGEYDVVEVDFAYFPNEKPKSMEKTLLVARSVLMELHLEKLSMPQDQGFKSWAKKNIFRKKHPLHEIFKQGKATLKSCDLINLCNHQDERLLLSMGHSQSKMAVFPFALNEAQKRQLFEISTKNIPSQKRVGFIGTFDQRKGRDDIIKIFKSINEKVPNCEFSLLGSRYLKQEEVRQFFPSDLRSKINVIPAYQPDELKNHLNGLSLGVFPSYLEGFPFAVLEMLSASLPVLAYDRPGPSMMISPEWTFPAGDWASISQKANQWLLNDQDLIEARQEARNSAEKFEWSIIAKDTSSLYQRELERIRT